NSPASLTYAGAAAGAPYDGTSPLYGVAQYGGQNDKGAAFELTPSTKGNWSESVLYDFCSQPACADGAYPAYDLLLDTNGNLFGVTSKVAFKLSPSRGSTWKETVLHTFCSALDCADGDQPSGGLIMDAGGNLFGVTALGGNPGCPGGDSCGVLYK